MTVRRPQNALIATKPLQLIIGEQTISEYFNSHYDILILVSNFSISEHLIYEANKIWDSVKVVPTKEDAVKEAAKTNAKNILSDGDVGLSFYFAYLGKGRGKNLYVYEEGIGTYRNDLVASFFKRAVFKLIGAGHCFGGSRFNKSIFVYNKNLYIKNTGIDKCKELKISFPAHIRKNYERYNEYFKTKIDPDKNKRAAIYLTNYEFNPKNIDAIRNKYQDHRIILKPHPHLKSINIRDVLILDSGLPFEILALRLLEVYEDITVIHHGSSASKYCNTLPIKFILIENLSLFNSQTEDGVQNSATDAV